jgi:maltose/moltooligosaccharide transporter
MEPFRAFIADKLVASQRTAGFVMQSLMIGIGASFANALPWVLGKYGVVGSTPSGIPLAVKYSFQAGAVLFLVCVLWTVFTTDEFPPEDMEAFQRAKAEKAGVGAMAAEVVDAIRQMPKTMKQLAVVQLFTWLGLFCMWLFFVPATARHVFGAVDVKSDLYEKGAAWGGTVFAFYSITCFVVALVLPRVAAATSRKTVHTGALLCGALGLLSVWVIHEPNMLILSMIGVGVAWASILSMPYAILSSALPTERMGVYMGVFNFFIVLPEIFAALFFGPLTRLFFGADNPQTPLYVVMLGGLCLIVAAICVQFVHDAEVPETLDEKVPSTPSARPLAAASSR